MVEDLQDASVHHGEGCRGLSEESGEGCPLESQDRKNGIEMRKETK
jgi:hypothetical protein